MTASEQHQYQDLLCEKDGGIVTFTLNRPKAKNALTAGMFLELERHLLEIAADDSARVVVFKGANGDFSAGADLVPETKEERKRTQSVAFNGDVGGNILERCNRCILQLRNLQKPVIASIEGNSVGVGFSLALAADLRIASSTSRMGVVFSKIGLGPDGGASYFLRELLGPAKALELLFTGEILPAKQALELGLINQMVEPEELEEVTLEFANRLAHGPTVAYAVAKANVYQGASLSLENALDLEARYQNIAGRSADSKEGIKAFIDRRKPNFIGK